MGIKESSVKLRNERKKNYKEASHEYESIVQSFDNINNSKERYKRHVSMSQDISKMIELKEKSERYFLFKILDLKE